MNNIISRFSEAFYRLGGVWVPQKWFSLFIHLAALLALVTAVCCFAYNVGSRNRYTQVVLLIISTMLALLIPAEQLQVDNRFLRTWLFVMSVVAVIVLPRVYPQWVLPELGQQRRLRILSYVLVGLLLVGNFFVR